MSKRILYDALATILKSVMKPNCDAEGGKREISYTLNNILSNRYFKVLASVNLCLWSR